MEFVLMHKDIPVMDIDIDEHSSGITSLGAVHNLAHLPIGVGQKKGVVDAYSLNQWWKGRAIPASRSGIREALELLRVSFPQELLTKCLGLSLSDQYWVNSKTNPVAWKDVNFFENSFSDDVGNALFGSSSRDADLDLMSPDNTSDGWLKKKWVIADGKRQLIKGGSNPYQQEPLNEALSTSLMRRLGVADFVSYTLTWDGGLPYSVCDDFITPDTELVSAWHISQTMKKENHVSNYDHYLRCCEALGIPNVRESLDRLLTVDYLIANTDRHFNNFGAVRNAETLEWVGVAPIFDCGTSLWHDQLTQDIRPKEPVPSKPFRAKHSEQIELVSSFDWCDFGALDGIDEEWAELLSTSRYIDEQRRSALCYAIKARTQQLEEIAARMSHSLDFKMEL